MRGLEAGEGGRCREGVILSSYATASVPWIAQSEPADDDIGDAMTFERGGDRERVELGCSLRSEQAGWL